MFVIQRVFLIDTEVYDNLLDNVEHFQADMIEIMPSRVTGFFRKTVKSISDSNYNRWIAYDSLPCEGGFRAWSIAVTTSNTELWKMDLIEFLKTFTIS